MYFVKQIFASNYKIFKNAEIYANSILTPICLANFNEIESKNLKTAFAKF